MRYIGKKIVTMFITLIAVSFLVFLAFTFIPGDPATSMLGMSATPEKVEALREQMGLNRPFFVRYFSWLISFISGDMGTSYSYQMSVKSMIQDKMPVTLAMTGMAFLFILLISIPLGISMARHEGNVIDRILTVVNQLLMSIPPFFSGILLTFVFGIVFHFFTPGGYISYTNSVGGFLGYLILPALAIALPKAAMAAKLLRGAVLDEAGKEYVRTAYSRGNTTSGVLYSHILKNALIPVITFLGMALADMIAGSLIIEQVFSIPGLGRILISSISNRDYPVVEAVIVFLAGFILIINFIVDVIYRMVDPRIEE